MENRMNVRDVNGYLFLDSLGVRSAMSGFAWSVIRKVSSESALAATKECSWM